MKSHFFTGYAHLWLAVLLYVPFSVCAKESGDLSFIENHRQWPEPVQYKAELDGGAVFLTHTGFMYNYYDVKDLERIHEAEHKGGVDVLQEKIHRHAYEVCFVNADTSSAIAAADKRSYYHNYFLDKDSSHWAGHVPLFGQVMYRDLYPGIDAKVYSQGSALKYDFLVAPHKDPSVIRLAYKGVSPRLTAGGDLVIRTSVNTITERAPYAYQVINGEKKQVVCRYRFDLKGNVTFSFPGGYDHTKELVIDPVVVFASYSGGNGNTFGYSATYDHNGNFYAAAHCLGSGWPTTTGAYMTSYPGGIAIGINKFNPSGTALLYSSYYGPASDPEAATVNNKNQLIICCLSSNTTTPVTPGCFSNAYHGGFDFMVARFSEDGSSLLAATFVGGSGYDGYTTVYSGVTNVALGKSIGDIYRAEAATDSAGNIYIASYTQSSDFPVTAGAAQTAFGGMEDACVFKLDSSCSALQYSTFLGGSSVDAAYGLSVNASGEAAVTGGTSSTNFPVTTGVLHPAALGGTDAFVTILNASGTGIQHSTYLGTSSFDHGYKAQYDHSGNVYICGQSIGNYPVSAGAFSMTNGSVFVDKLSPDLSTSLLSTRFGIPAVNTDSMLIPTAFMADDCGNIYFAGFDIWLTPNLPVTANTVQTSSSDFWFCKLTNSMSSLNFASYYGVWGDHTDGGGSHFSKNGILYEAICNHTGFPTTPGAWQVTDLVPFLTDQVSLKIDFQSGGAGGAVTAAIGNTVDSLCKPGTVQFANSSTNATGYEWNFGDGSAIDTSTAPSHFFAQPGIYHVKLHAYNPGLCVTDDTATLDVHVFNIEKPQLHLRDTLVCKPGLVTLSAPVSNLNGQMYFHWEPASAVISGIQNMQTVVVNGNVSNIFTVTVTDSVGNLCKEISSGVIHMNVSDANFYASSDTSVCAGDNAYLYASGGSSYSWSPDENISSLHDAAVTVTPVNTTTYTVTVSNTDGCTSVFPVTVTVKAPVHADAGPDQYIKGAGSAFLQASGGSSYHWYPDINLTADSTAQATAAPPSTTQYFVTVHGDDGCSATDSVMVYVVNTFIPNAFSPNGDGRNDQFSILFTDPNLHLMDINVYNRWGECVFYTNNIYHSWDGSYKGKPAEAGVYYYLIEYAIGERQYREKGDVTLVR
ncbi:gliding motility-associated C-terminal domain-containing protein [Chitinophagaceae bacterium MMS25-I14]